MTAYVVCASQFGGPGDPTTGSTGYKGDHLHGKSAFAELSMGTALGNLPYKTKLRVTYRGNPPSSEVHPRSAVVEKLDIGLGGAPCSGHARRIDLWYEVAQQIGFSGTGLVAIERVDGKPISGPNDTNAKTILGGAFGGTTTGAGVLGTGVGPNTEKEGSEASEKFKEGVESVGSWTKDLGKILQFIGSSSGWVRIGKVVLGAGLLVIALSELTKISPEVPSVSAVGAAKKVVK